jgi:hypothetical protein
MDDTPLDDLDRARSTPPAEGERRAIGGYAPQYRVAAQLIYRALRERTLEWVRIADPEAGRVDDIVIGDAGRIDAFQVKWAQYGGTLTFRDLVSRRDGAPSLIAQLADGWQRLHRTYPGRRAVVHLVTNQVPSFADSLPMGEPPARPRHFAAFVAQAWEPLSRAPLGAGAQVPGPWRKAWDALQAASGLGAGEYDAFVRDCDLDLASGAVGGASEDRDHQLEQADISLLAETLKDLVADRARVIELSLVDLLVRLRWEKRFGLVSAHEFRDPEIAYRPVESSLQ